MFSGYEAILAVACKSDPIVITPPKAGIALGLSMADGLATPIAAGLEVVPRIDALFNIEHD